jgi:hypothetical protein
MVKRIQVGLILQTGAGLALEPPPPQPNLRSLLAVSDSRVINCQVRSIYHYPWSVGSRYL